jgi:hypothetical protein
MQLCDVYLGLGPDMFGQLVRGVSIGKLKTYQLYEGFKASAHLNKVNTESLRKAVPRFWSRIEARDEDFAKDFGQAVLVSQIDMIAAVLDFLGIPHENGFFNKDLDAKPHLGDGWQARTFEKFHGTYPDPLLLFYINHLGWELAGAQQLYVPAPVQGA